MEHRVISYVRHAKVTDITATGCLRARVMNEGLEGFLSNTRKVFTKDGFDLVHTVKHQEGEDLHCVILFVNTLDAK
jgi:hypothetical protein